MRPMATGYSPIRDGHGFRIIHGDGPLFIMVAGTRTQFTDRCGFLITNGDRDGLAGEDRVIITDGRRSGLVSVSISLTVMSIMFRRISGDLLETGILEEETCIITTSIIQTMLRSSTIRP